MRIALFAVVMGVVFALPASGQIALQISYEHDLYGWDEREGDRHIESGVIYFTDDGRMRHDRTMGTGERVSDVTLPSEYTLAINHDARTVIRGRPGAVLPIPGLSLHDRPNFDDSFLSEMGRFLEAFLETAAMFGVPGLYEAPGLQVSVSEPLGIQTRWGVPLHGHRSESPAKGDRPATYTERWYYHSPLDPIRLHVFVEKTSGVVGGKVLEQRRATNIRQVSVDADLFSVPDGYQLLDWKQR